MKSTYRPTLLALAVVSISTVSAQSGAWGQCGGIGWSGATTCVSGYTCTYSNPYYSQCLPGSGGGQTTTAQTTLKTTTTSAKTTTTSAASSGGSVLKYWFSFGDSYTQTGFSTSGTQPSSGNPLGNPTYPGYTSSGGANWVDLVTTKYKLSTILTYNLAIGGATVDSSLVAPSGGSTVTDEVNTWLSSYANKPSSAPWSSDNTLFSIFIGINDLGSTIGRSDIVSYTDQILTAEFNLVGKLYNSGARKFMFVTVPPTDRTPLLYGNAQLKTNIARWNSRLATFAANFQSSHSGSSYFIYDAWADFNTVLNNPTAYGLSSDVKSYGSQSYFWYNNYHPSVEMHDVMAKSVSALWHSKGLW